MADTATPTVGPQAINAMPTTPTSGGAVTPATTTPATSSSTTGSTSGTSGSGSSDSDNLSVPPLGSLTPTATPTATYNPTSAGPVTTGTASDIGTLSQAQTAAGANVAQLQNGQIDPTDSTNAASQLDAITNANSPYVQLAKQQGLLTAAGRGLENSSLGAGASEASAVAAAAPLAEQNASGATQSALQQQQLQTQTSEFNASQQDAAQELAAQLGTSVSQSNAQLATANNQFNASQQQASDAANAAATNSMAAQTAALTEDMNKQDLSGTQAARLAQIQANSNQLIATNQTAASLYAGYMSSMSATMANQNISPGRAADTINAMQSMLDSGLSVIDQINGMSLDVTNTTEVAGASGPQNGPTSTVSLGSGTGP